MSEMEQDAALRAFLTEKGIDPGRLRQDLPQRYAQLRHDLAVSGPKALDYAKKFLWNDLRLAYPLGDPTIKKD